MAQDCASGAAFTGPIRITSGGTYTGNWQSPDRTTPVVQIFTTQPVTIVNSRLRGPGDLLTGGPGTNVTVQESCFVGTFPAPRGTYKGRAIALWRAANVRIEHNDFDSTGGYELGTDFSRPYGGATILVLEHLGDGTANSTIKIRYNRFHNLDGRFSDGLGGYLATAVSGYSIGIHTANIFGLPGMEIAWNQIINEPYQSGSGDSINILDTSGTAVSPMQVHDNYIQGGWDADPANGDGLLYFGAAITTDGIYQTDPRLTVGFLKIHDNQAVGFGNVGMSISIGHDVEMYNNRAVSSGQLSNGTSSATSWATGFQHMNGWRNNPPSSFFNNSVHDNVSGVRKQRRGSWEREDYRFELPPAVNSNNASFAPASPAAPTRADEANEFVLWTNKLTAQGIRVGSQLVSDASVTITDSPDPAAPNANVTYTITVAAGASGPITLTVPIPAGATFVSATDGGTASAGAVTFPRFVAGVGQGVQRQLVLRYAAATTASVTATIGSTVYDPVAANNSATATTTIVASALLTISGPVRDLNDMSVAGVTMTLSGSQAGVLTTDLTGQYAFTGLVAGGTYTVTPTRSPLAFNPPSRTFANLARDEVAGFLVPQVGTFTHYLAEGATSGFFDMRLALVNPGDTPTTATLTFLRSGAGSVVHAVPVPARTRVTVDPKTIPGLANGEFSTTVGSQAPLVVDRSMSWDVTTGYGAHAETAVAAPAVTWYFAEGSTVGGFNLFYLLQNPNAAAAEVRVRYLRPSDAPLEKSYALPPNSRTNIWVNQEDFAGLDKALASTDVSAVIESTNGQPIIVERAIVPGPAGPDVRRGPRERGCHRTRHAVVPCRRGHGTVLRPVRAGGERRRHGCAD